MRFRNRDPDRIKLASVAADIDHDTIAVEPLRDKRCVDYKSRAMQRLRGAKQGAAKGMGNHDVVADLDSEHEQSPGSEIIDTLAQRPTQGRQNVWKPGGQIVKC